MPCSVPMMPTEIRWVAGWPSCGPYADHQFIHLVPSTDFEEQRRFRQGTQAADLIDYFAANFSIPRGN
jgi:hypothetical protein